jgi:transposase InsO family protein
MILICSFTRWTELYWCVNNSALCARGCLLQFFGRFDAPSMIRSDRGSHFMNYVIREFLLRTSARHSLTLAYSKQENAIVGRVNKEVNRRLRAFTFHSTNLEAYKLCLPFMQRIINSSVHSSTGASPASLLFGNQLNLARGILVKVPDQMQLPTRSSKII